MEIVIRLSGVQLGPYSEEQVRKHLSEGLLTLDDPAKHEGMSDWAPLHEVLPAHANLAGPPPETAVEAPPEEAPESPDEPTPEEPVEEPRRAPDPPPGFTHLPNPAEASGEELAPVDVGALSKKTLLIEPTAPIRAPAVGPSTLPITTTAPLSSVGSATKKMSRAAMIKALSQGTAPLPTKAINVPPRPAAGAPPDARKGALRGLIQALTAKTVPMRNTPAAPPPAGPAIQSTEPMPTRHVFKPGVEVVPPFPPADAPAKPEAPPTILITEPMPTRHTIKHNVAGGAPPAFGPAPKKQQPAAGREELPATDFEVPTVKLPPPVFKHGDEPPAPGPEQAASEPVATEPVAAEPVTAAPPAAPRPPRSLLPVIIGAWAVLAALMLYYVWSPYHAAALLRSAVEAGDVAGLNATVDFPAVRESLQAQIGPMVEQAGLREGKVRPGDKSSGTDAGEVLDNSVNAYVSAEAIAALLNKSEAAADAGSTISPDAAAKILAAVTPQPGDNEGLASVGDFVIDRGTAVLHLKFTGFGWKLKRVELRPDLAAPTSDGSAAPLVAPVVDTYLDQGRAMAKNGDNAAAIAAFTQALAIDPKSSLAYNERAGARQAKGDLDGAISDYTQALAIDPQMAAAYNGRGSAESAKSDFDAAIADFSQAIHFDSTLATAYDGRGNARIGKDDADGAIADFTQAIALDPNMAAAYSDRGFARQANGNPNGAIADYTQALALAPKSARTLFNRGLALQAEGNLGAAILDFDHALAFDPKLADAYFYRGNAKSANHDFDGAISDYTQAVALNAKIAPAYTNRGLARQAKGDLDGAVADYTQALALDPKIADAYFNRAVIEAQRDNLDAAIADSTQALYLDARNAQAYSTRGFAKLAKGNLDGAQADLKQFCDLAPRDHDADHVRLYLWLIAKAQNSGGDADQELSSALAGSWNSSPDDLVTKTAAFLLGNTTEANYLDAAHSSNAAIDQAQRCQASYFAGMKRLLMGDKKGAIDAFHQCVATQQKDFSEYTLAQAELQALEPPAPPTPAPGVAPGPATPMPPRKP